MTEKFFYQRSAAAKLWRFRVTFCRKNFSMGCAEKGAAPTDRNDQQKRIN
jgi:hypothetical protein